MSGSESFCQHFPVWIQPAALCLWTTFPGQAAFGAPSFSTKGPQGRVTSGLGGYGQNFLQKNQLTCVKTAAVQLLLKRPFSIGLKNSFFFFFLHNITVLVKSWLHSSVHVHVRSLSLKTARIRKKNDVRVIQIQCSTAIIYKTKHLSWLSSRVICIWQLWSTAGFLLSAHRIESPLLLVQKWILVRLEVSLQSLFLSVKLWKEVQLHVPFSLMTCK